MNERERHEGAKLEFERDGRALERDARALEHAVHVAFMELPPEAAPPTLLPRVMAAAAGMRERPWYARGWHTWPQSWQRASLAVCLVVLATASLPVPLTLSEWWPPLAVSTDSPGSPLTNVLTLAEDAGRAARLADSMGATAASIWRTFFAPLLVYATAISALLCAALALFAAALDRLVPGKASY